MADFGRALQENLLTLLCFDDQRAKVIRGAVPSSLFEGVFQEIAKRAYAYIDRYTKAPSEHIADELEDILLGDDKRKAEHYQRIVASIFESRSTINAGYVMDKLMGFLRQQTLKAAIIESAELLQAGEADSIDKAETVLTKALRERLSLFDPGIVMSDIPNVLSFLDNEDDVLPCGIRELDERGLGPLRKGVHLLIGLAKAGKTWSLIHLGKTAAAHGYNVVHVSLEMSRKRMAKRYVQSILSVPKTSAVQEFMSFVVDEDGRIKGFDPETVTPKLAFSDPDIRIKLAKRMRALRRMMGHIIIRDFPTGHLTVQQLDAYLESLASAQSFHPDLLIVDYPALMSLSTDKFRFELGAVFKDLRGLAIERNLALAAVNQSNRVGLRARMLNEGNVAEDWSIIGTVDTALTYSQTPSEHKLGLARLHVAAARDEGNKMTVVIAQNYALGQFALRSVLMTPGYEQTVDRAVGKDDGGGDDDVDA